MKRHKGLHKVALVGCHVAAGLESLDVKPGQQESGIFQPKCKPSSVRPPPSGFTQPKIERLETGSADPKVFIGSWSLLVGVVVFPVHYNCCRFSAVMHLR